MVVLFDFIVCGFEVIACGFEFMVCEFEFMVESEGFRVQGVDSPRNPKPETRISGGGRGWIIPEIPLYIAAEATGRLIRS